MNYDSVVDLVKEASRFVFDEELKNNVKMKGAADYVTAVDLKISSFVKAKLELLTPNISFSSEEEENEITDERWILDPVDGTTNLVYDYNFSSVSLAYCKKEKIEFGVIYNPFNRDLFVAKKGEGVYFNGKKLPKAPDRKPCDSLVEFGAGSTKKQYTDESFLLGREVFRGCLDLRRVCSSALAIAYIAAGKLNGYFERAIKPCDYAAATLMLEECGIIYSDWDKQPIQYKAPTSFVCGTPQVYEYLTGIIEQYSNK